MFLLKSFMVKCLESLLTPIPPSKIVSALKKIITSDLLNTKFCSPQTKLNNLFFWRYCKNITNFLFWGYFEIIWLFPSKTIMPTYRNFDVNLHVKKWTPYITFFRDIVKILQTCYLQQFENAWLCLSTMIVSPFRKFWWSRCCRYIDIVKKLQSFYFGNFGNACPSPSKIIVSIWRRLSCLSGCKKSTSLYFFLEIFQINSQLAILGNLGMPGCTYIVSIWKNLLCLSTG